MPQIMVLGESGFGKSASYQNKPELGIKGLDPNETFVITATTKMLPSYYKLTTPEKLKEGNRIYSNDGKVVANVIKLLAKSPFKNIIIDDVNYLMQDYYMKNALSGGWDTPKNIGFFMGLLFDACAEASLSGKNVIIFGHYEEYKKDTIGTIGYRMKTTGNMTREYITPEGKMDILMFGKTDVDFKTGKVSKVFVTENDGVYPAKSQGIFEDLYIPNDMGYVIEKVNAYYNGD
jgi:hypothetical protein